MGLLFRNIVLTAHRIGGSVRHLGSTCSSQSSSIHKRDEKMTGAKEPPDFGLLFDIDGVIMRGSKVLPFAPDAFKRLVDSEGKQSNLFKLHKLAHNLLSLAGKFRVPTVFVTNAGNTLRQTKADQLSNWLKVKITEDQVVLAHSPLKLFHNYHDKHVLVVGQGPVLEIAKNIGFTNVTSMDQFRHAFPSLDAVDHKRRRGMASFHEFFCVINYLLFSCSVCLRIIFSPS